MCWILIGTTINCPRYSWTMGAVFSYRTSGTARSICIRVNRSISPVPAQKMSWNAVRCCRVKTLISPLIFLFISTVEKVQFAHTTCVCANVLSIHQQNYNFTSLECTKAVRGEIEKTTIRCGRSEFATILRIGYRLSPNPFLPLIEVCYDETNGTTLYTEHKLYGHQLKCNYISYTKL